MPGSLQTFAAGIGFGATSTATLTALALSPALQRCGSCNADEGAPAFAGLLLDRLLYRR
jgi:hypothetical protein